MKTKSFISASFCLIFLLSFATANHVRIKVMSRVPKAIPYPFKDNVEPAQQTEQTESAEMTQEASIGEASLLEEETSLDATEDDDDDDEGPELVVEYPNEQDDEEEMPSPPEEATAEECLGDLCPATENTSPPSEEQEDDASEESSDKGSDAVVLEPTVDEAPVGDESEEVRRIRAIIFNNITTVSSPVACFLGGGVAAGKSFALRPHLAEWGVLPADNYAHIAADTILFNMDGWNSSNRCAALRFHTRSAALQSQFFREALARRVNILYEGSLSHMKPMMERIKNATARGYTLNMVGATVPTLMAAERAIVRAHEDGKFIPLTDVVTTHVEFSRAAFAYMPYMNTSMLFETSDPTAPQLIIKDDHVVNVGLLRDFQLKVTDREDIIAQSIPDRMYAPYRTLCDCDGISDPYVCSSSHGESDGSSGATKAWRITAIIFMVATALFLAMLVYGSYKWKREREDILSNQYQSMAA